MIFQYQSVFICNNSDLQINTLNSKKKYVHRENNSYMDTYKYRYPLRIKWNNIICIVEHIRYRTYDNRGKESAHRQEQKLQPQRP